MHLTEKVPVNKLHLTDTVYVKMQEVGEKFERKKVHIEAVVLQKWQTTHFKACSKSLNGQIKNCKNPNSTTTQLNLT